MENSTLEYLTELNNRLQVETRNPESKMKLSIQTIEDALWWVQDGLDNAEFKSSADWRRTKKCRDELKACLANAG